MSFGTHYGDDIVTDTTTIENLSKSPLQDLTIPQRASISVHYVGISFDVIRELLGYYCEIVVFGRYEGMLHNVVSHEGIFFDKDAPTVNNPHNVNTFCAFMLGQLLLTMSEKRPPKGDEKAKREYRDNIKAGKSVYLKTVDKVEGINVKVEKHHSLVQITESEAEDLDFKHTVYMDAAGNYFYAPIAKDTDIHFQNRMILERETSISPSGRECITLYWRNRTVRSNCQYYGGGEEVLPYDPAIKGAAVRTVDYSISTTVVQKFCRTVQKALDDLSQVLENNGKFKEGVNSDGVKITAKMQVYSRAKGFLRSLKASKGRESAAPKTRAPTSNNALALSNAGFSKTNSRESGGNSFKNLMDTCNSFFNQLKAINQKKDDKTFSVKDKKNALINTGKRLVGQLKGAGLHAENTIKRIVDNLKYEPEDLTRITNCAAYSQLFGNEKLKKPLVKVSNLPMYAALHRLRGRDNTGMHLFMMVENKINELFEGRFMFDTVRYKTGKQMGDNFVAKVVPVGMAIETVNTCVGAPQNYVNGMYKRWALGNNGTNITADLQFGSWVIMLPYPKVPCIAKLPVLSQAKKGPNFQQLTAITTCMVGIGGQVLNPIPLLANVAQLEGDESEAIDQIINAEYLAASDKFMDYMGKNPDLHIATDSAHNSSVVGGLGLFDAKKQKLRDKFTPSDYKVLNELVRKGTKYENFTMDQKDLYDIIFACYMPARPQTQAEWLHTYVHRDQYVSFDDLFQPVRGVVGKTKEQWTKAYAGFEMETKMDRDLELYKKHLGEFLRSGKSALRKRHADGKPAESTNEEQMEEDPGLQGKLDAQQTEDKDTISVMERYLHMLGTWRDVVADLGGLLSKNENVTEFQKDIAAIPKHLNHAKQVFDGLYSVYQDRSGMRSHHKLAHGQIDQNEMWNCVTSFYKSYAGWFYYLPMESSGNYVAMVNPGLVKTLFESIGAPAAKAKSKFGEIWLTKMKRLHEFIVEETHCEEW